MLTDTELAKLIVNWKSQTGTNIRGRMCVPTDSAMRINMYGNLVETLVVNYQYSEDDLLAFKTVDMIVKASLNPKSPSKDTWKDLCEQDWKQVVADRFPMQILMHDPSKIDTSRRVVAPPPSVKVEVKPELVIEQAPIAEVTQEDLGSLAMDQEEFEYMTKLITNDYDREFIADMLSTHIKDLTKKQIDRLSKIRKRVEHLKGAEVPTRKGREELEYAQVDPRLLKDNPIDRSIFEGLPPVNDPVDEEFMKLLKEVTGE